jgi:hypothetical protein
MRKGGSAREKIRRRSIGTSKIVVFDETLGRYRRITPQGATPMKLVLVALLLAIPIFADTCWSDRHDARQWRSEMRHESLQIRREAREGRLEAHRARLEFQREMRRTREEVRREVERDRREALRDWQDFRRSFRN